MLPASSWSLKALNNGLMQLNIQASMTNEQTNSSEALYLGYTSVMDASLIDNGMLRSVWRYAGFWGDGKVIE